MNSADSAVCLSGSRGTAVCERMNASPVATTNAKGAMDLVARLGDQGQRVVSRLGEMGTWCGITAEDYRFLPKGEAAPGPAGSILKGNGKHRDSDRQAVMADIPF